ncbi:hypothetical protein ACFX2I_022713 [Malus domestica]
MWQKGKGLDETRPLVPKRGVQMDSMWSTIDAHSDLRSYLGTTKGAGPSKGRPTIRQVHSSSESRDDLSIHCFRKV